MSAATPRASAKLMVPLGPLMSRLVLEPTLIARIEALATAAEAIARLEADGALVEACQLTAHAMPKREAVWWACMCARSVPDPQILPVDAAALEAAEAWVRRPEELVRRAALAAAEAAAFRSAEAWAAMGAFWSGGSMAPEGQPVVPAGEHLTGHAIGGGVVLAGIRRAPQDMEARLKRFLTSARDIAGGGAGRMLAEGTG